MHKVKERIKFVSLLILAIFPVILTRLFQVQVIEHEEYRREAERNLEQRVEINPKRGSILDRNGKILVQTAPSYSVYVRIGKLNEEKLPQTIAELCSILATQEEEFQKMQEEIAQKIKSIQDDCEDSIHKRVAALDEKAKKIPYNDYKKELVLFKNKLNKDHLKNEEVSKFFEIIAKKYNVSKKVLQRKYRESCKDFHNRKYLVVSDISKKNAIQFDLKKFFWDIQGDKVEIQDKFAGLELGIVFTRQYCYPDSLGHILGHTGPVDEKQLQLPGKEYKKEDTIGKSGIEKFCEEKLRGTRGYNVQSRPGRMFTEFQKDGEDVTLTIDIDAQLVAEKALDKQIAEIQTREFRPEKTIQGTGGAAVVVDIESGEIIVLATSPRYDSKTYSKKYQELLDDPFRPLENRAIFNKYNLPPGSIFKIMVAIYALQYNLVYPKETIGCQRELMVENRKIRCTHTHGTTDMSTAIEGSCNIYFYKMGERLGPTRLVHCARLFGYGEKCLPYWPEEQEGVIPSLDKKWTRTDQMMFGIGQRIQVTPLQVARSMAMIANRGKMPHISLLKEKPSEIVLLASKNNEEEPYERIWEAKQAHWNLVHDAMEKVITGRDGTATSLQDDLDIGIAAKTGTAEVGKHQENQSWFAGFFPKKNPKYAFAVFIEYGGFGGKEAGPVSVAIINQLAKKLK
jgi:penicillin-binding protein 2